MHILCIENSDFYTLFAIIATMDTNGLGYIASQREMHDFGL
jgi:hypothetical protein